MGAIRSFYAGGSCDGKFRGGLLMPNMKSPHLSFSGIGDEAGTPIELQIRAHQLLQRSNIDLRLAKGLDGQVKNVTLLDDESFSAVAQAIKTAAISVPCFASSVANWNRPINGDFDLDVRELETAIPRMQSVNSPFIRVMSWQRVEAMDDAATQSEVVRRMRILTGMAEAGGIVLLHENCAGWAGESAKNSIRLVEEIASPNFALLYDTGNPVSYLQNPWDFYTGTKQYTRFVHIKDAKGTGEKGKEMYTYAGEGDGMVRETIKDLISLGYQGILSIEPHLAAVIHKGQTASDESLFGSYILYASRFMELVSGILTDLGREDAANRF